MYLNTYFFIQLLKNKPNIYEFSNIVTKYWSIISESFTQSVMSAKMLIAISTANAHFIGFVSCTPDGDCPSLFPHLVRLLQRRRIIDSMLRDLVTAKILLEYPFRLHYAVDGYIMLSALHRRVFVDPVWDDMERGEIREG